MRATLQAVQRGWRRSDDGSAALETVVLAPPMLALIALAVIGMRIEVAAGAIEAAAHDAARSASISRNAADAQANAAATANASLTNQGLSCQPNVVVNTSGFALEVGTPATVSVQISCNVTFSDIAAPGMPGSRMLQATFVSPLDWYRARQ
ncbi:pilus assembly protein [Micromonospora aurantiaca (nom. illeg.)]|uniref:pilus assembly protein n=1 Tax=Micromonospora aurantiaca (nom. illeg.) TaxID=47850 RepID=UPI00340C7E58